MHSAVPLLNEKIQKFAADFRASQHDLYFDSSIGEARSPIAQGSSHVEDEFAVAIESRNRIALETSRGMN